jgi:prepilin-type N-terminal cleavage/methylation domain-containing protein
MRKNSNTNKYSLIKVSTNRGMTLIELLVVLAIFMIVASITIFDYARFRSSVSVQNLADDIALSIRRAQNYAIGVKNIQADFSNGYGIHFSTNASADPVAGSNKSFIIFNDVNGNKKYDYAAGGCSASGGSECIDLLTITSSDQVKSICSGGSCVDSIDITFIRPEPNAYICSGGSCGYGSVDIVVEDLNSENTKTITVSSVGQISIR